MSNLVLVFQMTHVQWDPGIERQREARDPQSAPFLSRPEDPEHLAYLPLPVPPPSSATENGGLVKAEGKDWVWLPHLCVPEAYQMVRHREEAQKNIWPMKPWGTSGYCGNCAFNIKIRSVHSIPIGCSLALNRVTMTEPPQTRPRRGHV